MSRLPDRTPEARLILEALKPGPYRDPALVARLVGAGGLNGKRWEYWAAHHGVSALMVRTLTESGLPVPAGILQQAKLVRMRNLMLAAALVEAVRTLEAAGIRSISFKGPLLSQVLYGDIGIRPSNDVDLLIPENEHARSVELLAGIGFRENRPDAPGLMDTEQDHHVELIRADVKLEIHTRLYPELGPRLPFDHLWSSREMVSVADHAVPVLGVHHRVHHLSIHGTRHGFLCLKWLADLAHLLPSVSRGEWQELLAASRGTEYEGTLLSGWRHLALDLGLPLPPEVGEALNRSANVRMSGAWFGEYGRVGESLRLYVYRFRLQPRPVAIRGLLRLLFVPTRLQWDLVPWLSPRTPVIFYVIRPIHLMCRLAGTLVKNDEAKA